MAVEAAGHDGGLAGAHPFKVSTRAAEMAAVTGSVAGAFAEVAAFATGALYSEIVRCLVHKRGEPRGAAYTVSQSLAEGVVGEAQAALYGVQFVGARLSFVESEASICLGANFVGGRFQRSCRRIVRPMCTARARLEVERINVIRHRLNAGRLP